MLNYEYPPLGGGASPVAHELNKRYVEKGHQVTVITMHFNGLPFQEVVDGVDVIRVKCLRSKKHMCYPWEQLSYLYKARNFLIKFLRSESFDVCHTHFILPTGLLAKWVKQKFQIPYLITPHGSDLPGFNPDRFKLLHSFTPPMIRSVVNEASFIATPSNYLGDLIRKVADIEEGKMQKIPNGIDPGKFTPMEKKEYILSTGRLLRRKGFHHLIKAVSKIDSEFELHIAGDGPMMKELKELAKRSKMPVVFHGWVDNRSEEYKKLLGEAKIYSLVSENENASIALLEAMSAGCAVITSNTTGCPETVGDAGIIVEPGNVDALKSEFEKLISETESIDVYGNQARNKVQSEFHWDIISQRYIERLSKIKADE